LKTKSIFTNEPDSLPDAKADFLLATTVTDAYDIDALTRDDIPGLIIKASHNLNPFETMETLNLDANAQTTSIEAKEVFAKGMTLGREYELKGNYLILALGKPSSTATAAASILALGYDAKECFSIKNTQDALSLIDDKMSNFEKLGLVSDNMLLYCAGFLLEATKRFHVVLGGGIQMAACLLIADKVREDVLMRLNAKNLTLATTSWVLNNKNSDIKKLLGFLSYTPHAIYTEFSFKEAEIPLLKKYCKSEEKQDFGAGAALAYADKNGQNNKSMIDAIELIIYMLM
jgi:NaMN:DMB phosphoribosyltransferase